MKGKFDFKDEKGKTLKKLSAVHLPFKRAEVVKKSEEMFKDSDPCIIHSTYAISKLGLELVDLLNLNYDNVKEREFSFNEIPTVLTSVLDLPEGTRSIKIS